MSKSSKWKNIKSIKTSVKMSEVAAAAGVSRVTVSRVLSSKQVVSLPTRALVLDAIARLGYNRNVNAGIMAGNPSQTVGLIVSNLSNCRIGTIVGVLSRILDAKNFQLVVIQTRPLEDIGRYLVQFSERRVDAIILLEIGDEKELLGKFDISTPIIFADLQNFPPNKVAHNLGAQVFDKVPA